LPERIPKLKVVFACDTEDNHPNYVTGWVKFGSDYDRNPATLNWGWTQYWRDLSECFSSKKVPVTWQIRVDNGPVMNQMLTLFKNEIFELKSLGDEIGIHIHTLTWNSEFSKWVQATNPEDERKTVFDSVEMFKKNLGFAPLSVRMGWNTMSNAIMKALDENGLVVDASAIPGKSSVGKFDKRDNIYDWSKVTTKPYNPNLDDYQLPGNMKILEIPISSLSSNKPSNFSTLVNKFSGVSALTKLLPIAKRLNLVPHNHFYITPYWALSICRKIIETYGNETREKGDGFLIGTFHPCDTLDPKTGKENLTFKKYVTEVINDISSLEGISVEFITLSQLAQQINAKIAI
jgi:hypothetical protein